MLVVGCNFIFFFKAPLMSSTLPLIYSVGFLAKNLLVKMLSQLTGICLGAKNKGGEEEVMSSP